MSHRSLILVGLVCVVASGCYGPGMRGQHGYGYPQNGYFTAPPYGQPQYIGQPQSYPGSYTVPGGVVLPPSDSTYTPEGSSIIDSGSAPIGDGWSGQDPVFDSGSDAGSVPRPDMYGGGGTGFDVDPTEPFGARSTPAAVDMTASVTRPVSGVRYGAGEGYTWLRGILQEGIESPGTMTIQYNVNPPMSDDHGGNFVLVPDNKLAGFKNGEIVEVRGYEDKSTRGPFGKPMYRVTSIKRLTATQ